jgi:hypothetical protein
MLHNEVIRSLYPSPMGRAYSTNGEKRNACVLLVRKPEGKRPLGKPRRRWLYNIKMYLGEIKWCGVD